VSCEACNQRIDPYKTLFMKINGPVYRFWHLDCWMREHRQRQHAPVTEGVDELDGITVETR
jgi:hypothetical protein